jgi:hypothetical protein
MALTDTLPWGVHFKILSFVLALIGLIYLAQGLGLALRSTVIYLPIWACAEFFHWVRMRERAKCRVCSFDPVLYKKDWRAARARVEARLSKMAVEVKERNEAAAENLRKAREKNPPTPTP